MLDPSLSLSRFRSIANEIVFTRRVLDWHPVVPFSKCDLFSNDKSPSRKLHQFLKVL